MAYPKVDLSGAGNGRVPPQPSFPRLESAVLSSWDADGTMQASIDNRPTAVDGGRDFVFYDGPPFANGLPHYGHLLTGYAKDLVPRYRTMRGYHVERRFGWDCHGLPAELEAERELGITVKAQVAELGVARFNEVCRSAVLRYTKDWETYVHRQARWADFEHGYKTLDVPYMESVLWAFKRLYDQGLVYSSYRVLPYCWRCETPLSNAELRMDDDVYTQRQDPAVTVGFVLETGERLLAWTTTPWTLPSNLAVAVGPDIDYLTVAGADGQRYILAEARVAAYARELGENPEVLARLTGADLVGRRYTPLFDYLTDTERFGTSGAFRVIGADFVTTTDGTGVVHMAPAYGEDDQRACESAGIPTILTVDDRARFTDVVPDFVGQQVFEANRPITAALRESGALLRTESYAHSYPHCWRCRTPLIYRAVTSWFVAVSRFRDRMVELNTSITWVPGNVQHGQFGHWLAGARDWSISRNRFWGTPIPIWVSDDPDHPRTDVYGSLDEIERDFGVRPTDLHRPFVDELTRPNPDDPTGASTMRRVPEVLDVWFDSGSMPFAAAHYPFENAETFQARYPADFIVEYIPQTRGWFYTLHVLATALFDRPAFGTCVAHGTVLGDDGRKMSKSLRNYPDVNEVFDRDGSDAMRWLLMSSPVLRGGNLVVTEAGIREGVRQALLPLWNAWYFFSLYANAEGAEASTDAWSATGQLDRYLLAKTRALVTDTTTALDGYDIAGACAGVRDFLDVLTNWWIRRSRDRFWAGNRVAFDTLATVLETVSRLLAPLLPLTADAVWRGLTGGASVHLADWPEPPARSGPLGGADEAAEDQALVRAMDSARAVCGAASALRKARGLRNRLPLRRLTVAAPDAAALAGLTDLIAEEVNVKEVVLTADVAGHARFELTVLARSAGPRLGNDVQKVIRAVKAGDWSDTGGIVTAAGIELLPAEYERRLVAADPDGSAALPGEAGVVVLDTEVTPELAAEGLARDVVRAVQQARRDAGLDVADRIGLRLTPGSAEVADAVGAHQALLAAETLAVSVDIGPIGAVDGDLVAVQVTRA